MQCKLQFYSLNLKSIRCFFQFNICIMDMDGRICCCQAALSSLQQDSVDFQSNGVFPLTLSVLCQICWASVFAQGTNTKCASVLFYPSLQAVVQARGWNRQCVNAMWLTSLLLPCSPCWLLSCCSNMAEESSACLLLSLIVFILSFH